MLSLKVTGPGGSLSTVLIATPYWRDASRKESWQAAMAMAADSCDQMASALVLQLGSGWGQQQQSDISFNTMDSKFVSLVFVVC
jgi:hypothetical protein